MNETFVIDDIAPPIPATSETSSTLGGHTVLPRLEHRDGMPTLVSTERPRFESTGLLGTGGLGEVLGARDLDIGRRVAIKRIRPDRRSQAAFLRFVQEVRTVGRLDHPHIVPVHDVSRDEQGQYYFVMKHVEGKTLHRIIEDLKAGDEETHARFPFEERLEVVKKLMHAVSFAHEQGVVHRDLKPENVIVGTHGEVTLLDWGIAKQVGQPDLAADADGQLAADQSQSVTHTRMGQLIGTPRYMAPEQARAEPADERTDVFGLSLILYEFLALQHPLDDLTELDEVLEGVRTRRYGSPFDAPKHPTQDAVPADLGWFVYDGLAPDPDERYPTVQAMLERLQRRAEGDIPTQCPVTFQLTLLNGFRRMARRRPFLLMALLLGGMSGLLGVGLVLGLALGGMFGGVVAALAI